MRALLFFVLFGCITHLMLRWLHASWASKRSVVWVHVLLVVLGALGALLREQAQAHGLAVLTAVGRCLQAYIGAWLAGLFVSLPLGALIRAVVRRLARAQTNGENRSQGLTRRQFIEAGAAAVPAMATGLSLVGGAGGMRATRLVERRIAFAGLPNDLHGFRILQLTDMHLGAFLTLEQLEDLTERAFATRPDLVVLTGDFCDNVALLEDGLRLVLSLKPRFGTFAALGNHEHFGQVSRHVRAYEQVGVDLLINHHRVVRVGSTDLTVLGVDDPIARVRPLFYRNAVDLALSGAPRTGFRLGLCHRPAGFDDFAASDVHLTLSGHTHGAQLGVHERSVFERRFPEARLWGTYEKNGRKLYTSSGGGHWFPFRLGCPSEAPLIVLARS